MKFIKNKILNDFTNFQIQIGTHQRPTNTIIINSLR